VNRDPEPIDLDQRPRALQLGVRVAERAGNQRARQYVKRPRILSAQQCGDVEAVHQTTVAALSGI